MTAEKCWRCARLVWHGQSGYLCCFAKDEDCWTDACHYVNLRGEKKRKKTSKNPAQSNPILLTSQKNTPKPNNTTFEEIFLIRRYGLSNFNWDQNKSQEQLTLRKLARRCGSGMHCLVLTRMLWSHIFVTSAVYQSLNNLSEQSEYGISVKSWIHACCYYRPSHRPRNNEVFF